MQRPRTPIPKRFLGFAGVSSFGPAQQVHKAGNHQPLAHVCRPLIVLTIRIHGSPIGSAC